MNKGVYLTTADGRVFFRETDTGMIFQEVDGKLIECSDLVDDIRHLFNNPAPQLIDIFNEDTE